MAKYPARGNVPTGKVQRAFYLPEELADALRIEAAKRNESQSSIVEKALRRELGMVALTWQVIEDNGGGLHLAVFEGDKVVFYGYGYERNEDGLRADLDALRRGDDPRTDGWETQEDVDDPQRRYDELTSHPTPSGWQVVADNDGIYYERMGEAARRVFGEPYDGWVINTGFLGGNIFSEYDERPVDEAASCARYKDMLHEALEKEFPGADIHVHYEVMASGAIPEPMKTYVVDPEGHDHFPGDYGTGGRMAERVEDVAGRLWESWKWVVYKDEQ